MSTARIDPTARIEDGATLGEGVEIGAFCTVGPHVVLEAGVKLINAPDLWGGGFPDARDFLAQV